MERAYLTAVEAAEYLAVAPKTLANWRSKGGGPVFCRLGKAAVRYTKGDLDAWAAEGRRRSTSDRGDAVEG